MLSSYVEIHCWLYFKIPLEDKVQCNLNCLDKRLAGSRQTDRAPVKAFNPVLKLWLVRTATSFSDLRAAGLLIQ